MGNRKQPFGYKMALGEIVIQESEAKLVQEIFLRYIAGESLNELTESLRQQDISYDEGRLWNKNMVARILADARYTGEKEYPKLIDKEQLIATNEKRSNKDRSPKGAAQALWHTAIRAGGATCHRPAQRPRKLPGTHTASAQSSASHTF